MRSTFAGFETAKSGIYTAQTGINLTGHNIANAETPGFTRQRLDVAAKYPYGTIVRFPSVEQGIYGNGVRTLQVTQIRDQFLDREFRDHNTEVNYYSTRLDAMRYIESIFDPTDNEISKRLQGFFDGMADISKNPEKNNVRPSAMEAARELCNIINITAKQFETRLETENEQIKVCAEEINNLATRIADINRQIYTFELSGHPANDLRDSLNSMLDELSGYADIEYSTDSEGKLNVYLGTGADAVELVTHTKHSQLSYEKDANGDWQVFNPDGSPLKLNGGELKGHLDMRDSQDAELKGIPYWQKQLNNFVKELVTLVNDQHKVGFTNTDPPQDGIDFFDPAGLTAETIKLNQQIIDNVNLIACASDKGGDGNNENVLEIAALFEKSLDSMLREYMAGIGSETKIIYDRAKTSLTLSDNTDAMRMSISSVSMDEEMTNLIKYQHSYSAAARALTTMDEALDVLINRTGRVGL